MPLPGPEAEQAVRDFLDDWAQRPGRLAGRCGFEDVEAGGGSTRPRSVSGQLWATASGVPVLDPPVTRIAMEGLCPGGGNPGYDAFRHTWRTDWGPGVMSESIASKLVTANHVLANEGIIRGVGHVSVREPGAEEMRISRSRSPAYVSESDVITMDFDGAVLDDEDADPYKETVIHRAIYRNRDDVNAVVHHHAPAVMPFTITDVEVKPAFHMGALFYEGVPTFDAFDPEFGRLVVTEAEGERMAAVLGDRRAQLIEGHGANVVGASLEEAVLASVYLVMNATYQYQAEQLGSPRYFTDPEAARATIDQAIFAPAVVDRVWEFLTRQLPDGG